MKYYSRDNRQKTKPIETGSKEFPILKYRYNENGKKELVTTGIKNRYEEAQRALPGVEIKTLLARYSMGDDTALERAVTFYGDFTETPKSYIEALNIAKQTEENFYDLPIEVRNQFNNSPEELLAYLSTTEGKENFRKMLITETPTEEDIENVKE